MKQRKGPSGPENNFLEYLLKADVQLARYTPSSFPTGAAQRAFVSKAFAPDSFAIEDFNTIVLPKGKYVAIWSGVVTKLAATAIQLALASTSGGVNMAGFNMPIDAYTNYITLVGMWTAQADGEELWIQSTSGGAAPTMTNNTIYIARLGDPD